MGVLAGVKKVFGISGRCCEAHELLAGVRRAYSAAASDPERQHPFPVGKSFAVGVGYSPTVVDSLPAEATASFVGVANVGEFAEIAPGAVVLDIGCGSGLDALLAAGKGGANGRVVGLDFSMAMLHKAVIASRLAQVGTISCCCADAGRLPIRSACIDVVLVNGIFNLNPERGPLFAEMARVLKPGGTLYAAELVFTRPQIAKEVREMSDWFS